MKPKEKAKEIFDKMYSVDDMLGNYPMCRQTSKKCAIIYVEGILEIIRYHGTDIGNHSLLFYKQVKQEKLKIV